MLQSVIQRFHAWRGGAAQGASGADDQYTCGTLRYTRPALVVLFGWLLWGDFAMRLMDSLPPLLAMQLKDCGVSNQSMGLLMTSFGTLGSLIVSPAFSYSSDRCRSRWGRRRPFLMVATPFVTLFLILIPWSPEIASAVLKNHEIRALLDLLPVSPLLLMFGILILGFQLFHLVIAAAYSYLIPDVVPEPLIGRFYGLFRLVGSAAGIIFNWFVFGRAHGHMRLVFACFAALYGMSFLLMCWKVREGNYPEVPEEHGRWFSPVKRYFSGCFGQARNWLLFLAIAAPSWVSAGVAFLLFFYRDTVGLSETEYGRLMATTYGIFLLCSLPFGWLVDRWGSQKALKLALLGCVITSALSMFLIYDRLTAYVGFISMNIVQFLQFFAMNKWTVDMYPRAQYGQFSSAAGILGSIGVVVLSPVIGRLVDAFGNCYRLCLVPFPICYSLSLICVIMLSRRRRYQTSGEDGSVPAVAAAKAP